MLEHGNNYLNRLKNAERKNPKMTISETIKQQVAQAIQKQSLRSVAEEAGVDPAILSRWLNGKKIPRADTLDALAKWAGLVLKKK